MFLWEQCKIQSQNYTGSTSHQSGCLYTYRCCGFLHYFKTYSIKPFPYLMEMNIPLHVCLHVALHTLGIFSSFPPSTLQDCSEAATCNHFPECPCILSFFFICSEDVSQLLCLYRTRTSLECW